MARSRSMSDLDLVRDLFPDLRADDDARRRVRASVAAHAVRRPRRLPRRPLAPAVGTIVVAAAAAVATVMLLGGTNATVSAPAARVLHEAARAARNEPSVATLAPGQYLYT